MKKRYSAEQIVLKLRQADVGLGKELRVPEVCQELGISEQTYYRWRQKYGGMAPEVARQLKALERENARLPKSAKGEVRQRGLEDQAKEPPWGRDYEAGGNVDAG